jgi:hypothetical protein
LANRIRLTNKARDELEIENLDLSDIRESLMNATEIYKTIRSTNPRTRRREHLHIIQSSNFTGVLIYSKGKLLVEQGIETFYVLVSSKRAI